MAITGQTDSDIVSSFTTVSNPSAQFSASVDAGAFLVAFISWATNETTTVDAISDGVNTWQLVVGPIDHPNTTLRGYVYVAANATAGQHTVAVTLSSAVSGRIVLAEFTSDNGAPELDVYDASPATSSNVTSHASNVLAASAARAGAIIGALGFNASETLSAVGANEINLTNVAGERAHLTYEPFAAGGSHSLEATTSTSAVGTFFSFIILEPSAGGATVDPSVLCNLSTVLGNPFISLR